jgi:hypothetical protein
MKSFPMDERKRSTKRGRPRITCGDDGGISRQTGKSCKRAPAKGRKRCQFHGGQTPQGIEHWNYQGKGRSKCLPVDLAGQYRKLAEDPELVALREAIATAEMNSRRWMGQLQDKVGTRWDSVQETFKALEDAIRSGDADKLRLALAAHGQIVREGNHDNWLWGKITEADEHFMRLVIAERRYQLDSDEMLSTERLTMIVTELLHVIKSKIEDDKIPRSDLVGAIGDGVYMLMNRGRNGDGDELAYSQQGGNGVSRGVCGRPEGPAGPEEGPVPDEPH